MGSSSATTTLSESCGSPSAFSSSASGPRQSWRSSRSATSPATSPSTQANSRAASPEAGRLLSEVWRIHSSCAPRRQRWVRRSEEVAGDLAGDLRGVVAQLRRQVVVEPEGGQPMDQGPGRHTGAHVAAGVGAGGGLGGRWVEQCPGLLSGPDELGVVGSVQLGAEHHLEVGPVGGGEADVGHPDLQEAPGGLVGLAEGGGQALEPVDGDRGQQPGLVAEVVGRGGMGDPGAAGEVPEADRGRSDLEDCLDGGVQQGAWEVAVMVGPSILGCSGSCGHVSIIARMLPLTRSEDEPILTMTRSSVRRSAVNTSALATEPAASVRERFTRGEWMLLGVVALAVLHHLDHVLRADNSGWPFTTDLLVYPIFALDFLLLRKRPWVRVGLVAFLFVALQVTHAIVEPPADQYGTWANGTSSVPHAVGQPNLFEVTSPVLGAVSVAVSSLLSLAVLAALVLLTREARTQLRPRRKGPVMATPAP